MDNLIATTIAVALIAVLAVIGFDYGTQAITNYQSNVEASKIISDAARIAAAWRSYARANNGNPSFSSDAAYCWGSNGATDLVTNYMSVMPKPPKGAADSNFYYYFPALYKKFNVSGSTTKLGSVYKPADSIGLWIKNPAVCQQIVKLGVLSSTAAVVDSSLSMTGGSDDNLSALSNPRAVGSPYDCIFKDTAGTGAPAQGDNMLFIYKVFDQNNFTTASRSSC